MVSRPGIEPIVLLDGAPAPLKCLFVERSSAGHRLDYAHLELDPGHPLNERFFDPLVNCSLAQFIEGKTVEVVLPLPTGQIVVHRGKIASVNASLSEDGPRLDYVSRIEPHHFGWPIYGMAIISKIANGEQRAIVREPIVFNPMLDGACHGNRSQKSESDPHTWYFFLDWRQSQTEAAREWNRQGPLETVPVFVMEGVELPRPQGEHWTVAEALLTLCGMLNPKESFVKNPDAGEIRDLVGLGAVIRDVQLQMGMFLPEAMDRLLEPYGYSWYLKYGQPGELPRIVVFRVGQGPEQPAGYQAPGQLVDPTLTSVDAFHLNYDVGRRLINHVVVWGAFAQVEVTVELVRAWSVDYDSHALDELSKGHPEWLGLPALARVWRDWVLNEDGSYVGLRPEITGPADLDTLLAGISAGGEVEQAAAAFAGAAATPALALADDDGRLSFYAMRKRFLPTISLADDGSPAGEWNGIRVQVSLDGGETWSQAGNENDEDTSDGHYGNITLLERECGIRFDDDNPPREMIAAGDNARVRVTATLQSDRRVMGVASGSVGSPNSDTVPALFDMPTRFALRLVHPSSTFYSEVNTGARLASQVDDRSRIAGYAESLLDAWNQAECEGPVVLGGVDRPAEIGNVVPKISGREILLFTKAGSRNPQVVGISYDFRRQTTILQLTAFRPTIL